MKPQTMLRTHLFYENYSHALLLICTLYEGIQKTSTGKVCCKLLPYLLIIKEVNKQDGIKQT